MALLLMHNWMLCLGDTGAGHQLICPLYAVFVTLPLSLMMLASQPRELLIKLALGFSLIVACCAIYMGYESYAKGISS